ncbi:hypothetical protein ACLK1S_10635 [Escherichia coli]
MRRYYHLNGGKQENMGKSKQISISGVNNQAAEPPDEKLLIRFLDRQFLKNFFG